MPQCAGTTRHGQRCRHTVSRDGAMCGQCLPPGSVTGRAIDAPDAVTTAAFDVRTGSAVLAALDVQSQPLLAGMYVIEVGAYPFGTIEYEGRRAVYAVYGPIPNDQVDDWMRNFPADTDLLEMYAVPADELEQEMCNLDETRVPGDDFYVNDPDMDDDGFTTGSLRTLPQGGTR